MVRHRNVLFMVVACLLIVIVGVSSYVSSQHGDSHLEAIMYIDAASMQLVVEGNSDDVNVSYENVCVRYGQNNTCEEYVREYMLEDLSGNILRMRIDYKEFTNSVEMKVLSFDRGIWIVRPNINYLRFTKTPDGYVQELVVDKVKQVTVTYDEANRQSQIHMWHDNTPGGKLVDGASTLRMKTSLNTLTFDILDELPPVKGLSYLMRINNFRTESNTDIADVEFYVNGQWVDSERNVREGKVFSHGPLVFRVGRISNAENTAELEILENGSFDRIYSKSGNYTIIDVHALPTERYDGVVHDLWGRIIGNYSAYFVLDNQGHNETYAESTVPEFNLVPDSGDEVEFDDMELADTIVDLPFLYSFHQYDGIYSGFGRSNDLRAVFSDTREIFFDEDLDEFFIASYFMEEESNESFLKEGLISYYKLDETSGDVIDSHGQHNGANHGATRGVSGKIENAFDFDGSDSYVDTIPAEDIPSVITVSMWVYPTGTGQVWGSVDVAHGGKDGYISNYDGSGESVAFRYYKDNAVFGSFITHPHSVPLNEWSFLTYTVNASNAAAIYVNGVEQAASTFGTSPTDHDRTLMLGKSINSQHQAFDGKIDEVGVWYRVLNATEINMLYNRGDGWTY